MIRLHHVAFSRSFRVMWLLEELGLEYEIAHYSIRDGSLRAPEFLALSPAGRVPALEIDGQVVFESGAIVQYLAERHPNAGLVPAIGAPDRARFLEAMSFAETMASLIEMLNMQHVFLRDPAMASPVVIKLTTARLAGTAAAFEAMLGDQEYLLPSGFSAADTMMGFNLLALPYFVKLAPHAGLSAYVDRITARAAYQKASARDGVQDFYTRDFYPVPEG